MTSRCIAAINFHAHHDHSMLVECCRSVRNAIHYAECNGNWAIEAVLFTPNIELSKADIEVLEELDISIVQQDIDRNGPRLNAQIDYARAHGFDTFFRVDADDTVHEQRFFRQIEFFNVNDHVAICGGGLIFNDIHTGRRDDILPAASPRTIDYLMNLYCLHPSLAFRLSSIPSELRYWADRVEDKQMYITARRMGLVVKNLPILTGTYNLRGGARRGFGMRWKYFKLNLVWCWHFDQAFLPFAALVSCAGLLVPTSSLRRIRNKIVARS